MQTALVITITYQAARQQENVGVRDPHLPSPQVQASFNYLVLKGLLDKNQAKQSQTNKSFKTAEARFQFYLCLSGAHGFPLQSLWSRTLS